MAPQRQSPMRQHLDQDRDSALRRPLILVAIGGVATLVLAMAVVFVLLRFGGDKALSDNAALIGALVALGGVFTAQLVSIALENRRSQEARELEAQRAHEAALQTYLEQVGKLLIEHPSRDTRPGNDWSTVVRAQTLAVLEGLDPQRKGIVIKFLYESGLINRDAPVISLALANLRGVDLSEALLAKANLSLADLTGATMTETWLPEADLRGSELGGADLTGAWLAEATLRGAILGEAVLRNAFMLDADLSKSDATEFDMVSGINLLKEHLLRLVDMDETFLTTSTDLTGADLSGTTLKEADLSEATLKEADLSEATLKEADLSEATLTKANLTGADLSGATLSNADLSGAKGITTEVIEEQAEELLDTTMPDGSKHQ